jgi:uncharacterized repeat protein (TIGR04138 family)
MNEEFYNKVEKIIVKDPRYGAGAYEFVMEGLAFAQKKFKRARHVTGGELLEALKDLSVRDFGPLAGTVLDHWGVHTTEDFGHIVFNMVEHQLLAKQDEDTFEAFKNGFDFREVLAKGYHRQLKKEISRIR